MIYIILFSVVSFIAGLYLGEYEKKITQKPDLDREDNPREQRYEELEAELDKAIQAFSKYCKSWGYYFDDPRQSQASKDRSTKQLLPSISLPSLYFEWSLDDGAKELGGADDTFVGSDGVIWRYDKKNQKLLRSEHKRVRRNAKPNRRANRHTTSRPETFPPSSVVRRTQKTKGRPKRKIQKPNTEI